MATLPTDQTDFLITVRANDHPSVQDVPRLKSCMESNYETSFCGAYVLGICKIFLDIVNDEFIGDIVTVNAETTFFSAGCDSCNRECLHKNSPSLLYEVGGNLGDHVIVSPTDTELSDTVIEPLLQSAGAFLVAKAQEELYL